MDQNAQALDILQRARDALAARLVQRVLDSELEITEDAEGGTYVSEIEAIYEQLGSRLAHLNAMLSSLPPAPVQPYADASASEIVYADLAASPSTTMDVDAVSPVTMLALPAPPAREETPVEPMVEVFAGVVLSAQRGDLTSAARLISEIFDVRPSQARRGAQAFERQLSRFPELGRRFEQLGACIGEMNEYAAATLLGECFDFQAIDALLLVRQLKNQYNPDAADSDSN